MKIPVFRFYFGFAESTIQTLSRFLVLGFSPLIFVVFLFSLFGCAALHRQPEAPKPVIYVKASEPLFVGLPAIPDSVDSLLGRTGWGSGRFAAELRKEIVFQFQNKGIPIVQDTAQAKSTLLLSMDKYQDGAGLASNYSGNAMLKTPLGERQILFGKTSKRAQSIERADPTVDNIRSIAEGLVNEARKKPVTKKSGENDYNPMLLMVF